MIFHLLKYEPFKSYGFLTKCLYVFTELFLLSAVVFAFVGLIISLTNL